MPDTPTAVATRLIDALEKATGFQLSMHGDDAALILDAAGVAEAVGKLKTAHHHALSSSMSIEHSPHAKSCFRGIAATIDAALAALTGTGEVDVG